jgi:pyruvate-formate lyase-activating enzyme
MGRKVKKMRVNSISIVPQEVGCNAKCKYCIAAMTHDVRKGMQKPGINLPKLEKCLKYAVANKASTAIITSSGETLLGSWTNIENILWLCKKYFGQIDLHTNASEIIQPPTFGRDFSQMLAPYLTNITITVPHYDPEKCDELCGLDLDYKTLFKKLTDLGIVIRLSCVMCNEGIGTIADMHKYIQFYKKLGISSIVFRELWIPDKSEQSAEFFDGEQLRIGPKREWCIKNRIPQSVITFNLKESTPNRKELNWYGNGQPYDINGITVSSSTCTQNNTENVIKSLVYRPDNYVYTDWDSTAKIM